MKAFVIIIISILAVNFIVLNNHNAFSQSTVELKLASQYPVGVPMDIFLNEWINKIKIESKGKLTIRIFPGGTLLLPPDLYDGVVKGVADLSAGWRYRPEGYKLGVTLQSTLPATSVEMASKLYDDIWNNFPEIRDEWKGVKTLWLTGSASVNIYTKKDIKRFDDLRGLQIRAPDRIGAFILKNLGMSPIFMSTADLPMGLEKGTIDGGLGLHTVVHDYKLEKAIKSILVDNVSFNAPNWVIMNWNSYNNLPPELKKIIDDNCKWGKEKQVEVWKKEQERLFKHYKESGINLVYLTGKDKEKYYELLKRCRSEIASELDKEGYPGSKLFQFTEEQVLFYSKGK